MASTPYPPVSSDELLSAAREFIRREAQALTNLPEQLDGSFARAVTAILCLHGKVITTGTGTSGIMAERLAHLLAVTGTPAFYLPCLDALHGGMGSITPEDLVIALSKGGESAELVELVSRLRERQVRVFAITERPESSFAQAAEDVVTVRTEPADADAGGLIAMGSTLVAGAWGDALAYVLMAVRGHSWEEVVDVHPGGIVGQQTELPERLDFSGGSSVDFSGGGA
ncbi:KpsF/GutQ family sugar-phosphate isomerase [Psychromicrobium xiongbiense]|uniref:KpsF/GutQ family sugar-phosphate isomerase n=1 Tax=Psychromicrobium xiongbiense TaxID=3051184 RepID=UPI002553947E|nr:SIS domain-containing protein [Psychromicrobium sp. YIM S02556]